MPQYIFNGLSRFPELLVYPRHLTIAQSFGTSKYAKIMQSAESIKMNCYNANLSRSTDTQEFVGSLDSVSHTNQARKVREHRLNVTVTRHV
jgi:hypothetical protein